MCNSIRIALFLSFSIIFFALSACNQEKRYEVKVEEIAMEQSFYRLDSALFASSDLADFHISHQAKLGEFYARYIDNILNIGMVQDPALPASLRLFVNDPEIKTIYSDVQKAFPTFDLYFVEINDAFKRYHHFFPEKPIPNICTYISGFAYSVAATDSMLGIGLDRYLGRDYIYYAQLRYPQYKRTRMESQNIAADALKAWMNTEFEAPQEKDNLLNLMVHEGKMLFMIRQMLPDVHDTVIFPFTAQQMLWCNQNEMNVWGTFVDKQLLYSSQPTETAKFLNEGPFTPGFPRESPAQLGQWIGYRIVSSFMEKNKDVTFLDLMLNRDAQLILNQSGYKPKKL